MITLGTGVTFQGIAGTASVIAYTLTGDEISSGADSFKELAQGLLTASTTVLYTVPGSTSSLIKTILISNTSSSPVTGIKFFIGGSAVTNQIFTLVIPANGSAKFDSAGWSVYDGTGQLLFSSPAAYTGDVTGSGSSSIALTIAANAVTNAKLANMSADTIKGNNTAGSTTPIDLTAAQTKTLLAIASSDVSGLAASATTDTTNASNISSGTLSASRLPAFTGDVTTTAGSSATTIAANAVSNSKFRQGAGLSVVGVTGNATANEADIVGTANQVLNVNSAGTALGFGAVNLASSAAAGGILQAASMPALTGDVTTVAGALAATLNTGVNSNLGTFGSASQVGQFTVNNKGLITAASNDAIAIANTAVSGLGTLSTQNGTFSGTSSGTNSGDVTLAAVGSSPSANAASLSGQALTLQPSSASFPGVMTAVQFTKLANLITGSNSWYDVTQYGVVLNSAGAAGANVTALNTLLSTTATAGSVIFFPPGNCFINAQLNSGSALTKAFVFYGCYGQSYIGATAAMAGDWITVCQTANDPTSFINMSFFSSGVQQTTGFVIAFDNSVQPVLQNCQFSGNGGTNQLFGGASFIGTNSGNGGLVTGCNFGQLNGYTLQFSGGQGSTIVQNCLGVGTTVTGGPGLAGIYCTTTTGVNGGSVTVSECDFIGYENNLLLNAVTGTTLASVFVFNSFFDQSIGSCCKLTSAGTGTIVRCRFLGNWFTLGTGSSSANAVEISTSGTAAHSGIEFLDNWVLNTPAGGGSPVGFNITAASDFSLNSNQIAGFTTGISLTPSVNASTKAVLLNNNIGPVGGVGGNTTGLLINAGSAAFGLIQNENNNIQGNTTNTTDNSTYGTGTAHTGIQVVSGNTGLMSVPPANYTATVIPLTTVTNVDSRGGLFFPSGVRSCSGRITVYASNAATVQTLTPKIVFGPLNTSSDPVLMTLAAFGAGTAVLGAGSFVIDWELVSATLMFAKFNFHNLNNAATGITDTAAPFQLIQGTPSPGITVSTAAQNNWLGIYFSSATASAITIRSVKYEIQSQ